MSPEAQRIAIAKHIGDRVEWHDGIPYWPGLWSAIGEGNERFAEFDPTLSLDAMHEAEKVLSFQQQFRYHDELHKLCGKSGRHPCYESIRATAYQRAEAFLRCTGKWAD